MTPNRGIFSLDPGGKSGLAWGIFDPADTLAGALANGLHKGSETIEGDEYDQIAAIATSWTDFYRMCVSDCCMDPRSMTGAIGARKILRFSFSTHTHPMRGCYSTCDLTVLTEHHAERGSAQDAPSLGARPISIAGTLPFPNNLRRCISSR